MTAGNGAAPRPTKGILGTIFLIVFIDLVGFGMVVTLLPRYGEMYQPKPLTLGLFMATYSFFQFLFAPILGRLSDRFGRRPVLLLSLCGAAFGYVLLALGGSLEVLFLSRAVAGASAGNISTAQAAIADVTGPAERAKGMGALGAAFGLGFIFGPAIGGYLFDLAHWAPGAAAALTSLAALALTFRFFPETRLFSPNGERSRARLDWRSLVRALRHPLLGLCLAAFFLQVFGFANFESSFVLYAESRFALTAHETGWIFLFVGVVGAVVQGGLVGRLTKVFGEARLVVAGAALACLALGFLPYLGAVALVRGALGVMAVGTGLLNPSLSSLASRVVDPDEVGGVMGIYQSMGSLARIGGPLLGVVSFRDLGQAWPFRFGSLMMFGAAALAAALLARLRARAPEAQR